MAPRLVGGGPAQPGCVLLVHFEDLKADLPAEVARVAAHLGLQRSAHELQAVAARCGFGAMKAATCSHRGSRIRMCAW